MALHVTSVDILLRPYLLVHGYAQQWSKAEIYGAKVLGIDVIEVLFSFIIIKVLILMWVHVEIYRLYVIW